MKGRSPIVFFVLICDEHKRTPLVFRRKLSRAAGKTDTRSLRYFGVLKTAKKFKRN